MKLSTLLSTASLFGGILGSVLPENDPVGVAINAEMVPRDNTTAAESTDLLNLTIDPYIVNPDCGSWWPVNLKVQYSPDPATLQSATQAFLKLLGGQHGSRTGTIVFQCTGQPANGTGPDDGGMKVVFFIQGNQHVPGGDHQLGATVEVIEEDQNFVVGLTAILDVVSDTTKHTLTFTHIEC